MWKVFEAALTLLVNPPGSAKQSVDLSACVLACEEATKAWYCEGVVLRQRFLFQDFRAVLLSVDMPRTLCPHRKWNLRNLVLGRHCKCWRINFSRAGTSGKEIWLVEWTSGEKVLQVRCFCSRWSIGVSLRALDTSSRKCKIQHLNSLFESGIRTVFSSVRYLTMDNGSLLLGLDGWKVLFLAPAIKAICLVRYDTGK